MLRNLSLNKWQQDWDSGDTGRAIFNILPKVTPTPASRSRESILFATGQVLFPAISIDSGFLIQISAHMRIRGKGRPSPLRNFLSHDVSLSFYKTKYRKYSTLVEKRTFK
ncbi:hypothetical protein AVEN_200407-1 [Araneus ventricosus]|uniref:Uncharacterized protein n=1 Tax=Araneus ventricosus TaxID=182803 RepID=A0A4Y2B5F7_ARAVE|nr:hypothetical protein AVEN_74214-1 [Araneus ventricosus]GBL87321.1 hypothetical protein AVEN_200407-1 [Araneus ventricosus]